MQLLSVYLERFHLNYYDDYIKHHCSLTCLIIKNCKRLLLVHDLHGVLTMRTRRTQMALTALYKTTQR